MKDALIVAALSLLPRKTGARAMGGFARTRASSLLKWAFVNAYGVDMSEAEHPAEAYPTLEDLFTRRLREGVRPVEAHEAALVSPVDGTVAFVGPSAGGQVEVAPGRSFSLTALVGEPVSGERDVFVLYLSPKDYHRVHVPREGLARRWRYLPGTLWPVFPAAVRQIDGLFAKNERLVVHCETSDGALQVVLVGAFGVGRITASVAPIVTNVGDGPQGGVCSPPQPLSRGDELGVFHLGSTVILLAEPGRWAPSVAVGEAVRVGRVIATRRS